ncbi:hypothetical protein [Paraburkholderia sp.]|uniref:hypothetical protein n=1 Tax=Paraburkholderia sp. TaxID=1926495 RepID=UPI0039E2CD5E
MNDEKILTHPAFDRPPVLNARRHGSTPRSVPVLKRERWERRQRELKAQQEAQRTPTPEARDAILDRLAYHLLMAVRAVKELG